MDAKKTPALVAILAVFAVACLAGVVLAALEYGKFSKSTTSLRASERKLDALLANPDVALTKESVAAAGDNLAKLNAAETALRDDLLGSSTNRFEADFKGDPGELGSIIKESVERWRATCRDAGIKLATAKPAEFAFGFSRYFQTGVNPQRSLREIHRQTNIVNFLVKQLVDAKLDGEVRLVSLEREPVEIPATTKGNFNKDEVAGLTDAAFRRDGLLRSEFFRIRFVGRTDVLRRLVNGVTDSGRALSVRGVEVAPASAELLAVASAGDAASAGAQPAGVTFSADFFGGAAEPAPAAPAAPVQEVVVADAPSDITVTLEYIEPVKAEATAAPAETPSAN